MKEKIIQILKENAKCSMNIHSDFDNVDITQFEEVAEEISDIYDEKIKEAYNDGFSDSRYDFDIENYR